jgi:hypothetical protein
MKLDMEKRVNNVSVSSCSSHKVCWARLYEIRYLIAGENEEGSVKRAFASRHPHSTHIYLFLKIMYLMVSYEYIGICAALIFRH